MKFFTVIVSLMGVIDITTSKITTSKSTTVKNKDEKPVIIQSAKLTTTPVPDPLRNIVFDYHTLLGWCVQRMYQVAPYHKTWQIEMVNFGTTAAGFNLTGFYIKFNEDQKTVFLEANIHGGEILATGVAVYVFNELLTKNLSSNPEVRRIIETFNWLILPVANPDGYMFKRSDPFMFRKQSWKKTVTNETIANKTKSKNRTTIKPKAIPEIKLTKLTSEDFEENMKQPLKRSKRVLCWLDWIIYPCGTTTRRTTTPTTPIPTTTLPKRPCIGINANLNFNYYFQTYGINDDVCEQNYPGRKVETEPITQFLTKYLTENSTEIILYISLHSNETRRIMIPFSNGVRCNNYNVLKDIAQKSSDYVRQQTRAKYIFGNIADLKEFSSGHSVDFAKESSIKYVYMIETQDNKWLNAPPSMIVPRGKEIMLILYQICRGVIREENRLPGQYQTTLPPASSQQNLHSESILIVPISFCLIIYQIYHPILFS